MLFYIRFLFIFLTAAALAGCSTALESFERTNVTPAVAIGPSNSTQRSPETGVVQQNTLNAGEIDDNAQWDDYLQYRSGYLQVNGGSIYDVNIGDRQVITVADSQNLPIMGARVLVYGEQALITESRTYANGETLFFPQAWADAPQDYRVVVQKDDTAVEFTLEPQASSAWDVTLDVPQPNGVQLDILFLLDATGSMDDEIAQLQNNILDISTQINQFQGNIDTHYGLVTYRDRGDDYITQPYNFVGDVLDFQVQLNSVRADGGGDIPESLNEGLHNAVQDVSWRGDDAIKLIFLVADAPPHLNYVNDYDYSHEMVAAAWQGIKIFPIGTSSLPPNGEFIFRQLAQYTLGHFIFLTYENGRSGEAGSSRSDLAAGDTNYSVEQLDDLVVRVISDEIAALDIPVEMTGFSPQLKAVPSEDVNPIPATFALVGSPRQIVTGSDYGISERVGRIKTGLELHDIFQLVLVVGFIVFLLVRSRQPEKQKRKRKNDEFIIEAEE